LASLFSTQWRLSASARASIAPVLRSAFGDWCALFPLFRHDVIGLRFGIRYGDFWDTGDSRILCLAALLAGAIVTLGFLEATPGLNHLSLLGIFLSSYGQPRPAGRPTDGGLGVAFSPRSTIIAIFCLGLRSRVAHRCGAISLGSRPRRAPERACMDLGARRTARSFAWVLRRRGSAMET